MGEVPSIFTPASPLIGLSTAKTLYCDALAVIEFQGTNARYVPFTFCKDEKGLLFRKVEFTILAPIASMTEADRLMRAFMAEHFLNTRD